MKKDKYQYAFFIFLIGQWGLFIAPDIKNLHISIILFCISVIAEVYAIVLMILDCVNDKKQKSQKK